MDLAGYSPPQLWCASVLRILCCTESCSHAFSQVLFNPALPIEATKRLHIIRALECRRICYRLLTHTASHLPDRFIFVFFHPLLKIIQDMHQAPDTMSEQR